MNWIKINEERSNLPEPCSNVLVTYLHRWGQTPTTYYTIIAYFDGDRMFYDLEGVSNLDSDVTAWMYLPSPCME
jgi:hypothetical protein